MRIALFTDGIFPYVIGGMQKHSYCLVKYLAQRGVSIDLYHTNQSNYDISKLEFFNSEEKKMIRSFVVEFPIFSKLPGHYIRESFEYSSRIFDIYIKQPPVDFVYVKGFSGWRLISQKKKGLKTSPIGINFHGYEMFQKPSSFISMLEQNLMLKSPVLFNVINSDFVFSYGGKITDIISSLGIASKRIIEIPSGIENDWILSEVKPPHKKRKFIFIGRWERRKGIAELHSAISSFSDIADFDFHFIGHIPDSKKINIKNVFYHGIISNPIRIKSLIDECDIFVCPSHSEGMPNVILEAMSRGLAIIATDVGAIGKMVSSENGWLLKSSNHETISKAISKAIDISNDELMKMKISSLEKVKSNFLWTKIIDDTIHEISQRLTANSSL